MKRCLIILAVTCALCSAATAATWRAREGNGVVHPPPPPPPGAVTYYVSPTGNDSNNGTSHSSPWQTITKVDAGHYNAGDSILFEGGQTFSGSLSFTASSWSATAANPVTIGSYGNGDATVDSGDGVGFLAHNVAGFALKNLVFVGDGSANLTDGIQVLNDLSGNVKLDYVVLQNLDVSGYGSNGVHIHGNNGASGFKDVTISYVRAHSNTSNDTTGGTSGILVNSSNYGAGSTNAAHQNVLIDHCNAYSNPGNPVTGIPGWSGAGITMGNTNGGTIQYSVAANNGTNTGGTVGIWAADATNIAIQFNESYGTATNNGRDGDGFDLDGGVTNSLMQYNYSHDNYGAGFMIFSYNDGHVISTSNDTMRCNVSQNDGRSNNSYYGGLTIGNDAGATLTFAHAYNNTVYKSVGTTSAATISGAGAPSMQARVANNIFYMTNGSSFIRGAAAAPRVSFVSNNFYSTRSFSGELGLEPVYKLGGVASRLPRDCFKLRRGKPKR
jgi:hypothetical protein